jgi:hypothetical protein
MPSNYNELLEKLSWIFMKKFLIGSFTTLYLSINMAYAENLACSVSANGDLLAQTTFSLAVNEQKNYISAGTFYFYVKNKGESKFELEIFNSDGPSRSYAEGNLRNSEDMLAWTLWTRDILLETNCKLAEEL